MMFGYNPIFGARKPEYKPQGRLTDDQKEKHKKALRYAKKIFGEDTPKVRWFALHLYLFGEMK